MTRIKIILSNVQNEFAAERKRTADYNRQDAFHVRGTTIPANEIMKTLQLKGEDNFRKRHLHPSIDSGFVRSLYPDAPKRRDQAYYLTEKGLALYAEISKGS